MSTLKEQLDKLHDDVTSHENSVELVEAGNKLRSLLDTLSHISELLTGQTKEDFDSLLMLAIK